MELWQKANSTLGALSCHPALLLLYQVSQIRCLGLSPLNAMRAIEVAFRGNHKKGQALTPI